MIVSSVKVPPSAEVLAEFRGARLLESINVKIHRHEFSTIHINGSPGVGCPICGAPQPCFDTELDRSVRNGGDTTREGPEVWEAFARNYNNQLPRRVCDSVHRPFTVILRKRFEADERALAEFRSWWKPTKHKLKSQKPIARFDGSRRRFKGPLHDYSSPLYIDPVLGRAASSDNVLDGPKAWPKRHGVTRWIKDQSKPQPDQDIKLRFVTSKRSAKQKGNSKHVASGYLYRDIVKSKLHREEVLELEKARELKVKRNTGGSRPLRADEDFLEWMTQEGLVDNREVVEQFAVEELQIQPETEKEAEHQGLRELIADSRREVVWDGEEFQLAEDREFFAGQVITRGRGRNKTEHERLTEQLKKDRRWKKIQPMFQQMIDSGAAWSALDNPEDTRLHTNGAKYNLSNRLFKRIKFEFDIHKKNYDTKKELAGDNYETFRKKKLEDYVIKKKFPTIKFTKKQLEDIRANDGRVVYAHITLDRGRWFKLGMDRHETYEEALHEVWLKSINEAFKKAGVPSRSEDTRTPLNAPELARAFKKVLVRYAKAFRPENIWIVDGRTPTVRAIAQLAWEEKDAA